jgi:preprotein translocase subunit SecF
MFIVKYRKIFYIISAILMIGSLAAVFTWGLNLGIDFKGGSLLEVDYPNGRPEVTVLKDSLKSMNLGEYSIRPTGEKGYIFRMKTLSEQERISVMSGISLAGKTKVEEKRFNSIGPLLGTEALHKAFISIFFVILCIVLFITFAFRKVSEPVSSWKYGLIAIFALLHDVLVPVGAFAFLGHFHGVEVDTLFVTALLVVLGFSIHDTIVVFDRVRENLRLNREYRDKKEFETVVGESINQTFVRSINTSLTTLLALVVLYFVGGEPTRYFSLALIVGITAGTYSSIFLGSPLLFTVQKWQERKNK